jgi:hypothetical protein
MLDRPTGAQVPPASGRPSSQCSPKLVTYQGTHFRGSTPLSDTRPDLAPLRRGSSLPTLAGFGTLCGGVLTRPAKLAGPASAGLFLAGPHEMLEHLLQFGPRLPLPWRMKMFDKFPPPVRATIEAFFKERHLAATADDHALELATKLELQHLDLSVGDAERIAREAVAERSASLRDAAP